MKLSPHPWWHPLFEILGYGVGYVIYRRAQIQSGDTSQVDQGWPVLAAAAIGALIGSRVLGLLEQAPRLHLTWSRVLLPGGRTTVGGLLGGWVAVELFRSLHGVDAHLGDLYPVPLCLGIAIGRIGCLVAGLPDGTQVFLRTCRGGLISGMAFLATLLRSTRRSSSWRWLTPSTAITGQPTPPGQPSASSWWFTLPGACSLTSSSPSRSSTA